MEKSLHIAAAAKNRFMRYGYAKTTMGDIAEEAGVSRQTLYNAFSSKEDIMRVVVRLAGEASLQQVTDAWQTVETLDEKLVQFHELVPVHWYAELSKAPDWAELIEGMHQAAQEEVAVIDADWKTTLSQMWQSHHRTHSDDAVFEVVDFFYNASLNAKHGATDLDHLRRRLATIRKAAMALL